jgi:hypothetical protein
MVSLGFGNTKLSISSCTRLVNPWRARFVDSHSLDRFALNYSSVVKRKNNTMNKRHDDISIARRKMESQPIVGDGNPPQKIVKSH